MSSFKEKVIEVVKMIPHGKVVSYGEVALYAGFPRGARAVGWILKAMEEGQVPWWRVVNKSGKISIKGNWRADKDLQKKLLQAEGVEVSGDYLINIDHYRFTPDKSFLHFEL